MPAPGEDSPQSPRCPARSRRAVLRGAVLLGLALLGGCPRAPVPADSGRVSSGAHPRVVLHPASGAPPVTVQVELARTSSEHMRGLMYRRELRPDSGMLFLFDRPEPERRFWMRNTYISLDMVFLDQDRRVVGIEERTTPHDERSRGPDAPSQYVLEVSGGFCQSHGVTPGSRAEFLDVD